MAANCKKDTTTPLPPATHISAFTFGCKVDGKIYTARGKEGLLVNEFVSYNLNSGDSTIYISARNTTSPNFSFDLFIHYLGNTGTYLMKSYPYQATFMDDSNGTIPGTDNTYTTTDTITGSVNVTYFNGIYKPYNIGTILAGTFQMDAVNGEGKVIHITEGRFDIGQ